MWLTRPWQHLFFGCAVTPFLMPFWRLCPSDSQSVLTKSGIAPSPSAKSSPAWFTKLTLGLESSLEPTSSLDWWAPLCLVRAHRFRYCTTFPSSKYRPWNMATSGHHESKSWLSNWSLRGFGPLRSRTPSNSEGILPVTSRETISTSFKSGASAPWFRSNPVITVGFRFFLKGYLVRLLIQFWQSVE